MIKSIICHNLDRVEDDSYTNKQLKEIMLLKILNGKISPVNMYYEYLFNSRPISDKIK